MRHLIAREKAIADDLAMPIHAKAEAKTATQCPEIDHALFLAPQKRMILYNTTRENKAAFSDHLAAGVEREGITPSTAEGTEIDHAPFRRPQEPMIFPHPSGTALPYHLATVVYRDGAAGVPSEGRE